MRLALLGSGKSYHATRWANALASKGIEVGFFSIHPILRPIDDSVTTFQIGSGRKSDYIKNLINLKRRLKNWNPDIVHSHYATGYGLVGALSNSDRKIISLYGSDIYEFPLKSKLHHIALKKIISSYDRVLSTSHTMRDIYYHIYPTLRTAEVTPFGVDMNHFSPSTTSRNAIPEFTIGLVKKLEHKYGVDILLRSLSMLINHYNLRIHLKIVGDGSLRDELQSLVSQYGIQQYVEFMGSIPNIEVPDFLRRLNLLVVPSRLESESFGVAAVEGMACGLPVVASNVGGLPEVVTDQECGIIVEKENPEALADAIHQLYRDDQRRAKMGAAGRKKALAQYDWDKNVDDMIAIYRGLLND